MLQLVGANAVGRIKEFVSYRPFMLERSSMMHVTNYAGSLPLTAEQPWILSFANERESCWLRFSALNLTILNRICARNVTWRNSARKHIYRIRIDKLCSAFMFLATVFCTVCIKIKWTTLPENFIGDLLFVTAKLSTLKFAAAIIVQSKYD